MSRSLKLYCVLLFSFVVISHGQVDVSTEIMSFSTLEGDSRENATIMYNSSLKATGDLDTSKRIKYLLDISRLIDKYGGLSILIIGGIGNSLTLLILSKKSMRQYTINICLISMTTADLLHTLIGQAGRHMIRGFSGTDPTSKSKVYCKIWFYLTGCALMYSTYVLVGISVFRCIAMVVPLKARILITYTKSRILCIVCLFLIPLLLIHVPFSFGHVTYPSSKATVCTAYLSGSSTLANYYLTKVRPWHEFCHSLIVPFAILMPSNMVTIYHLVKRQRTLRKLTGPARQFEERNASEFYSLVGLAVMYVRTLTYVQPRQGLKAAYNTLAWSVALFFNYLYHALNFFLYNVSSKTFRREFQETLWCSPKAGQRNESSDGISSDDTRMTRT